MKIGLACAGNGPGAANAHVLARALEALSICPEMISCTSLPAAPMLLWSRGLAAEQVGARMEALLSAENAGKGLGRFCAALPKTRRCALALCSADLETGVTVIWADGLCSDAWNLKIAPLDGAQRLALQSAVSPRLLLEPGSCGSLRLCDFSARYGCPLLPLKMAGMERVLSVVFTGADDPAGIAAESLSVLTGKNADLHYALRLSGSEAPEELEQFVRAHRDELYGKLLF